MKARRDSHADDSDAGTAAAARICLSRAITRSCSGGRILRSRVRRGGVGTRLGHEDCLGNGRWQKADDLRRGRALGEDSSRQELEGGSDLTGSVYVLRAHLSPSNPLETHAFGSAGAGAAAALPAVLFDAAPSGAAAAGASAAGAASPAVLFDAPAAAAGVALAAAVTVSFTVFVTVCAAAFPPFPFPFPWPASSAPKSPSSPPTPPPPFPFPFLASMPSPTRRISWEKPLACNQSSAPSGPETPTLSIDGRTLTSDRYPISSSRYCR